MHFKFWGQSLNKGTWLTVAAKDTNYFHQTVVITIKSCLSINQLLLTRAQHSMHFKGDPTFQSLQEVMNTISSLPLQEKGVGESLWECSYFKLFLALLQYHWNIKSLKQKCESSLPGLLQESLFHKDIPCVHDNLWRLEINARCLLRSPSTLSVYLLARLVA